MKYAGSTTRASAAAEDPPANTNTFANRAQPNTQTASASQMERKEAAVQRELRSDHPKHLRDFIWDDEDESLSGLGTTAKYSLTAPPLPHPPESAFKNSDAMNTIAENQNLFKIVTPIDVDHLESLLLDHPNRSFIDSVLVGL
jgi:hypothetical protein